MNHPKFINDYIAIINRYKKTSYKDNIGKALYVFIYDHPRYRNLILKRTGLRESALTIGKIESSNLKKQVKKFKEGLNKNSVNIFLLNDSVFLIPKGDSGLNYPVKFRRKDVGSKLRYFALFSLVNKAALSSKDWLEFRTKYRLFFRQLLKNDSYFLELSHKWGINLRKLIGGKSSKVTFVDSGVQATLTLFLAESLMLRLPNLETDIKLFCANPWLSDIFYSKYYTTDADYLFSLERVVEQSYFKPGLNDF